MSTEQQPQNFNLLNALNFRFNIKRAPNVNFFVTAVNLPSITLNPANVGTPYVNLPIYGDHVDFSMFDITFKIDEEMANYLEIYNWMMGIGFPKTFEQFAGLKNKLITSGEGIVSDSTLTILTSHKNSNIEITFEDCWPSMLSNVQFDLERQEVSYALATVSFAYKYFTIRKTS